MRTRRRKALLAGLGALSAAMALSAAPAQAGTYPMRNCNVPGYPQAGTGPWATRNFPNSNSYNTCRGGGGFGIQFSAGRDMAPNTTAAVGLRPPAGIAIQQAHLIYRARLHGSGSGLFVTASGSGQDSNLLGPEANGETHDFTSDVLSPTDSFFDFKLTCTASTPNTGCTAAASEPLEVLGAETTLREDSAPAGLITGGALVANTVQVGSRPLSFEATDGESGVTRVEALLDGQAAGTADFASTGQCRYDNWNACATRQAADLPVDTRVVPDGAHTLQLRVTDAAGNQKVVQAPQPVVVANGSTAPTGAANGSGATADARLTAHFSKNRTRLTKSWSSTAMVRGRLTSKSGSAIGGAQIDVSERSTLRGAPTLVRKPVKTSSDGRYEYRVPARLSSRSIRLQYRDHMGSPAAVTRQVTTAVRAAALLKASLHGVRIVYSGRVASGPLPKRGLTLNLQGRAVGSSWQTFATRRVSRKGRFSGTFRLRVRRPGVKLQVRTVIRKRTSYPYVTTHGRPVALRVR